MMAASHSVQMFADCKALERASLTQAFSEFITASARLELSYCELQSRVAALTLTLSERDNALQQSCAEQESANQLWYAILQALPCGILLLRNDGSVRMANPEAARLLALSAAQMPNAQTIYRHTGIPLGLESKQPLAVQPSPEQVFTVATSSGEHRIAVKQICLPGRTTSAALAIVILEDRTKIFEARRWDSAGFQESSKSVTTYSADLSLEEVERRHMTHVLEQVGGNRTRAAEILRVSVRTLSSKIKQYGLPPRRYA